MPGLVAVLSGQILPLAIMPDGLKPLLAFLPFTSMVDAPFSLWVGSRETSELGSILLHQLAWTVVFVLVGRALLTKGLKRLVVQG
jgi:ABC-2 type transport system permease protein